MVDGFPSPHYNPGLSPVVGSFTQGFSISQALGPEPLVQTDLVDVPGTLYLFRFSSAFPQLESSACGAVAVVHRTGSGPHPTSS